MELYVSFISTACAKGIEGFSLPLRNITALRLALLGSINSLQSLATWSVSNTSVNAVTQRQWYTLSSKLQNEDNVALQLRNDETLVPF